MAARRSLLLLCLLVATTAIESSSNRVGRALHPLLHNDDDVDDETGTTSGGTSGGGSSSGGGGGGGGGSSPGPGPSLATIATQHAGWMMMALVGAIFVGMALYLLLLKRKKTPDDKRQKLLSIEPPKMEIEMGYATSTSESECESQSECQSHSSFDFESQSHQSSVDHIIEMAPTQTNTPTAPFFVAPIMITTGANINKPEEEEARVVLTEQEEQALQAATEARLKTEEDAHHQRNANHLSDNSINSNVVTTPNHDNVVTSDSRANKSWDHDDGHEVPPSTTCSICFKVAFGPMKSCQCGKPDCNKRAHLICANRIQPGPSVSHPGTPAPALPTVLCSGTTDLYDTFPAKPTSN